MRAFMVRRDPPRDVDDEIRAHIEMRVEDLVGRGHSPEEARRRAEAEFGDAAAVRAETLRIDQRMAKRARRSEWLGDLGRDVKVGLRSLRGSPAFAVTAVSCAALGIGATAAVVSAAYAILVRPLPYPDADQIVAVYAENTVRGETGVNISYPDYLSWRDGTQALAALGMWTWGDVTISGDGEAERVSGSQVTANLFPLLGMRPRIGRGFLPEEETAGRNDVALLSDRLWRRRFGADPSIVGKAIRLEGKPRTVIGVMPPGFNFPDRGDVWMPLVVDVSQETHGNRYFAGAIGRMKPGVTLERAAADLHAIDARLVRDFPNDNEGWRADVMPLREDLVGNLRQPLRVFLWAVALVLLMVCANVANLMLARGAARGREIAVRTALGASRARLARQLLTESLLVAGLGGAFGVAVAWLGVRLLRYGFPDQTPPFFVTLRLDGAALAFVAATTLVTAVLFGVVPALRVTSVDPSGALREGARGASGGLHRSRLRRALVVGEITLSVVLMVGAMLLVRSYRNLAGTELGFDERGVLTARVTLARADYPEPSRAAAFYASLMERMRGAPGVTAAGVAQGIPFSGWNTAYRAIVEGAPPQKPGEELIAHFQFASPDFFKALGVGLVRGRWLADADRDTANPTALVNESMVKKAFGGRDPIGHRLTIPLGEGRYATVVGVVRDYRHYRLPQPMGPAIYLPPLLASPFFALQQTVVVRTSGDPLSLAPALRAAVKELDPRVAISQVQTLEGAVSRSLWRQRLQGNVLAIFAALSLVLACVGLYGVVSYAVAQRTRELGVRMALGATRGSVVRLVLGQSGRLVAAGTALGLVAAWLSARVIASLLYGVERTDPATFALVPLCLALVALAAAALPARRAARVDPIVAMRAE
ncbi:MAG: ADOP family duplicated permease [Gemmatimonadaceae bacterium]